MTFIWIFHLLPKPLIGILLSLSAVAFGLCTGIIVKKIGDDLTIFTIVFYRFLFSVPLLLAYAVWVRGAQFWQINQRRTLVWRIIVGTCGMVFWFMSVRTMPFGQATAMFQSSVLFVTLLSPFFLGERVGIYRWSAVIVGLLGVGIITDPFSGGVSVYATYGLLAALSGAVLSILLRRLGKGDAPASVALWYNGSGAVVLAIVVLVMPHLLDRVSGETLVYLVLLGAIGSLLQICFTTSYKYVDAVVVASLRYIQMPMSGIVGYFIFAEVMTSVQIGGAALIVASCIVIAWREMVRGRAAHTDTPA